MTVFDDIAKFADLKKDPKKNKDAINKLMTDITYSNDQFGRDDQLNTPLMKILELKLYDLASGIFYKGTQGRINDTNEKDDTALHIYMRHLTQAFLNSDNLDEHRLLLEKFAKANPELLLKNNAGKSALLPFIIAFTPFTVSGHRETRPIIAFQEKFLPLLKKQIQEYIKINYQPTKAFLPKTSPTSSSKGKKGMGTDSSRKDTLEDLFKDIRESSRFRDILYAIVSAAKDIGTPTENGEKKYGMNGQTGSTLYQTLKSLFEILTVENFDQVAKMSTDKIEPPLQKSQNKQN